MPYVAPNTVAAGETYGAAAHNVIVNDIIDHEARLVVTDPFSAAWTSYTPTFTNLSVGNGTLIARYLKVGRAVWFNFTFQLGSTSSVSSDIAVSLPVTASSNPGAFTVVGQFIDVSPLTVYPVVADAGTTGMNLRAINAAGTYATWALTSATVPFTWATNDKILCSGFYEAAS
jgi:hypothetical protein